MDTFQICEKSKSVKRFFPLQDPKTRSKPLVPAGRTSRFLWGDFRFSGDQRLSQIRSGTIIYGVIEENHKPVKIDDGYDQNDISREWLENVITSRIHPKIDGVKINPSERSGKYIYLVYVPQRYVPQSQTAHQAHNQKYYKRHNFKSEPLWDYEIRDVLNRVRYPALEPEISLGSIEESEQGTRCDLDIRLWNRGALLAQHFALQLQHPQLIRPLPNLQIGFEIEREVTKNRSRYSSLLYRNPPGIVIFPQDNFLITDGNRCYYRYHVDDLHYLRGHMMYWGVFADNSPPREGEIDLLEFHVAALVSRG